MILSLGSAVAKGMVVYCSGMAARCTYSTTPEQVGRRGGQLAIRPFSTVRLVLVLALLPVRRASCRGGPGLWPFAPCRVRLLSGRCRCLRRTICHIATEVDVLLAAVAGSGKEVASLLHESPPDRPRRLRQKGRRAFQDVTGLLVFRQAQRIVAVTRTPRPIPGMTFEVGCAMRTLQSRGVSAIVRSDQALGSNRQIRLLM